MIKKEKMNKKGITQLKACFLMINLVLAVLVQIKNQPVKAVAKVI